jgi:hypothetical protein
MKRYLILVLLLIAGGSTTQLWAQRMAPGRIGLEAVVSTYSAAQPTDKYGLNVALTVNGRNGSYQIWGLGYSYRQAQYNGRAVPFEAYTFEGGYSFRLLSNASKSLSFNAALSGVAGYETVNRGDMLFADGTKLLNEEGFIYGLGGRLSVEAFLSDHLVLLLLGRAGYFWQTSGEALRPAAGAGLRYNF